MGQQHLGAAQAIFSKLGFIHLGQTHLTDGGGGLQLMNFMRPGGPTQAFHAFGNGAAGDHDDLPPGAHQQGELPAPFTNGGLVQPAPVVGHQAGAHFHDDAFGITQHN